MVFNSFTFIVFVMITFLVYYMMKKGQAQFLVLLLASFIFYAWDNVYLLLLLLASLWTNAYFSYLVYHKSRDEQHKRRLAWTGVILNLAVLCFFKYAGLFGSMFNTSSLGEFLVTVPLPIGISFYTFQGISLLFDVSLAKDQPKLISFEVDKNYVNHILKTATFISFFPQLVAGPIMRSQDFVPQMGAKLMKDIDWSKVIQYLILGYFLKMVIADNLKDVTAYLEYPYFQNFGAYSLVLLMVGYSAQIFGDFAGYSFIAMGLAGMFGYELTLNFNYPYIADSIRDYWRRWHITLYDWFNHYVFNPFVIMYRQHGKRAVIIGTLLVFALSGIWHGPTLNFFIWGLLHGIVLVVDSILLKRKKKKKKQIKWYRNLISVIGVFLYITFSYIIFRTADFGHLMMLFKTVFTNLDFGLSHLRVEAYAVIYCLPVFIMHLDQWLEDRFEWKSKVLRNVGYGAMLYLICTSSGTIGDFIYFQF